MVNQPSLSQFFGSSAKQSIGEGIAAQKSSSSASDPVKVPFSEVLACCEDHTESSLGGNSRDQENSQSNAGRGTLSRLRPAEPVPLDPPINPVAKVDHPCLAPKYCGTGPFPSAPADIAPADIALADISSSGANDTLESIVQDSAIGQNEGLGIETIVSYSEAELTEDIAFGGTNQQVGIPGGENQFYENGVSKESNPVFQERPTLQPDGVGEGLQPKGEKSAKPPIAIDTPIRSEAEPEQVPPPSHDTPERTSAQVDFGPIEQPRREDAASGESIPSPDSLAPDSTSFDSQDDSVVLNAHRVADLDALPTPELGASRDQAQIETRSIEPAVGDATEDSATLSHQAELRGAALKPESPPTPIANEFDEASYSDGSNSVFESRRPNDASKYRTEYEPSFNPESPEKDLRLKDLETSDEAPNQVGSDELRELQSQRSSDHNEVSLSETGREADEQAERRARAQDSDFATSTATDRRSQDSSFHSVFEFGSRETSEPLSAQQSRSPNRSSRVSDAVTHRSVDDSSAWFDRWQSRDVKQSLGGESLGAEPALHSSDVEVIQSLPTGNLTGSDVTSASSDRNDILTSRADRSDSVGFGAPGVEQTDARIEAQLAKLQTQSAQQAVQRTEIAGNSREVSQGSIVAAAYVSPAENRSVGATSVGERNTIRRDAAEIGYQSHSTTEAASRESWQATEEDWSQVESATEESSLPPAAENRERAGTAFPSADRQAENSTKSGDAFSAAMISERYQTEVNGDPPHSYEPPIDLPADIPTQVNEPTTVNSQLSSSLESISEAQSVYSVANQSRGTQATNLFGQVATALLQLVEQPSGDSMRSVFIELQPAELGNLKIQVEQMGESIVTQVIASELVSSELLIQHRDVLVETLTDLGFENASVDISHQQTSDRPASDQPRGQTASQPEVIAPGESSGSQATTSENDHPNRLDIVA